MRLRLVAALAVMLACVGGTPLRAANLIENGNFDQITMTNGNPLHSTIFGTNIANLPTVAGWQTEGYNFIMMDNPGYGGTFGNPQQTLTGADDFGDGAWTGAGPGTGTLSLWGPDATVANGLTSSPMGGATNNFLAADGAFKNAPVYQEITGLEAGKTYKLSFWWAAAQQAGFSGATTEAWKICFGTCDYTLGATDDSYAYFNGNPGDQFYSTAEVANADRGFVPWQYEEVMFTATGTTATLSLLAFGTPLGQPPFSLIDGVSLDAVPEPTTWGMMLIGFGVIGGVMRTRRKPVGGRRALSDQIV